MIDRFFLYSHGSYQEDRDTEAKIRKIVENIDLGAIGSVLDVGCNEGLVADYFARQGKFAVGIDVAPIFLRSVLREPHRGSAAAFGVYGLQAENVRCLPEFDLVLVLSVHHWWVKARGDDYAKDIVRELIARSRRYFVIEFSSINDKYGYREPRFVDHDEKSVVAYAMDWLRDCSPPSEPLFVGSNRETEGRERLRYLFVIRRL
jgi:SAM-dependent methyltransferase